MLTLEPRKIPRQGRARVTVDAILDACAETLLSRGYDALTTNSISERAGVSIGTLYEYFPNREAVAAALTSRAFQRMIQAMRQAFNTCVAERKEELAGCEHLLLTGLERLITEPAVYKVLLVEAPLLFQFPVVVEAQAELIALSQDVRVASAKRLNLPEPETDAWLIAQMLSAAMLQIAFLDAGREQQVQMTRQLARLTYRMSMGCDPHEVRDTAPPQRLIA